MSGLLYIEFGGGLVWLLLGGDLLVRGSVSLARRLHVSPTIVALTVIAFGTSLPELVVVLRAALTGHSGLAVGNIVGSNIANVLLAASLAAVVHPLTTREGPVRRDSLVMVGVSGLFVALCWSGSLSPVGGVVLLVALAGISLVTTREAARAYREASLSTPIEWVLGLPHSIWTILIFIVVGAVGLPLGAKLVVDGAVGIAENLEVSAALVGLTVLAVSTSLPELATTIVAAARGRTEVVIGTVIGSNIFNLTAIMGVASVVSGAPITVAPIFVRFHFPVMLAAAVLLAALVWLRRSVGRTAGSVMLLAYLAYIVALVV